MRDAQPQPHVLIAGGGIAAVELALALHDLAGDRVRLTIAAPRPDFELRPLRTAEPFSRDHVRHHSLKDLAAQVGAELVPEALVRVQADKHRALVGEREIDYDALVLAIGGRDVNALRRALTFTGDPRSASYNDLLADIDEGYTHAVSFVVPPGTSWPLPLYELALMTAREARSMGIEDVRLQLVTPEATPLALFGAAASAAIGDLLARARIGFRGGVSVHEGDDGLQLLPSGEPLDAQRVVTLPAMEGPRLDGVPADEHGFIPIDEQGRVVGLPDVYAAGDGTTYPIKQGGIACQQADAIAELLAAAAGAPVQPQPFRPVLRGRVLAGRGAQYLEHALDEDSGPGPAPELRLWSVTHKVDGRYLSPWLMAREDGDATETGHPGDVEIDVPLPAATAAGRAALGHDVSAVNPAR